MNRRNSRHVLATILIMLFFGAFGAAADERPQLSLPIDCEPHKTCFIQNYVDVDPGPGFKDYACGAATYDGHSGVDFRVLSAAAAVTGVSVLASADGQVKAFRDGVGDAFYKRSNADEVAGRACGNGIIIDHGNGWETQYCHLKKSSLRVIKGQQVKRGEKIGEAGFSGQAEFAQVHLTVRHDGKIIDPFAPDAEPGACQRDARGLGLWQPAAAAAFPYKNGEIIAAGFVGAPPDASAIEADHRNVTELNPVSSALLIYGRFLNVLKGDQVRLVASGPGGALVEDLGTPLDRNKASYVAYAGKRRGDDAWAVGHYEGRVELLREGGVVATRLVTFDLK